MRRSALRGSKVESPRVLSATIAFLSYRDRDWVDAALDGVLAQTVPCQLLVSNDAGGDGTFQRIAERLATGAGPHTLDLLIEQPVNLGVVGHCNAVLPQATGDIVVMMAGDDVSAPDRVEKLLAAYAEHPETMAIGCDFVAVDADDEAVEVDFTTRHARIDLHLLAHSRSFDTLLGAALSFRREVFAHFGPLLGIVEDNALTLRACLLGDCRNLPDKLVSYRQHAGSVSHGIFVRDASDARALKGKRYLRMAKFLAGTAEDFSACMDKVQLSDAKLRDAKRLRGMYGADAAMKMALADGGFAERWAAMWQALAVPGRRLRALEYATKLWR